MNVTSSPPTITSQPVSQVAPNGGSLVLAVATAGSPTPLAYQWLHNGAPVTGGTGPQLVLTNLQAGQAGLYAVRVASSGGAVWSRPAVVGLLPLGRTSGSVDTREAWQNMHHPKGTVYDQFLLSGSAGTFTANPRRVARMSFVDRNGMIVQVEMSGAGATTVILANPSGPSAAALYNQPNVRYMHGAATIILAGADETTHLTIYSVGTATNPHVTFSNGSYNGWANVGAVGIVSANTNLGGVHMGNVSFTNASGFTGVFAPNVAQAKQLPLVFHNIAASADALADLTFAPTAQIDVKIAGGNLAQPNGRAIAVAGLHQVLMGAGRDSCDRDAPAVAIQTRLLDASGTDVTDTVVVNPP